MWVVLQVFLLAGLVCLLCGLHLVLLSLRLRGQGQR